MEQKGGVGTAVVSVEGIRKALAAAWRITPEEEKVVRMRHGVAAEVHAPLPRAAAGNQELEDELLLIEMRLLRAYRARARLLQPVESKAKDKIVRALRRKK